MWARKPFVPPFLVYTLLLLSALCGDASVARAQEDEAPAEQPKRSGCLAPRQVPDADGDFARFAEQLSAPGLCITVEQFVESGRPWFIQVIENTLAPGPLWAVLHDNENAAFATAVWAVTRYGGTVVAVDTGGRRNNRGVDPNRNFGAQACRGYASPRFTSAFLRHRNPRHPIIALHTNDRGSAGRGGSGHISINTPPRGATAFRGRNSTGRFASEDTLVFVASTQPSSQDGYLRGVVSALTQRGINVIAEHVTPRTQDCSLSNYAATRGIRSYFNAEVVHGDTTTQRRLVEAIMQIAGGR